MGNDDKFRAEPAPVLWAVIWSDGTRGTEYVLAKTAWDALRDSACRLSFGAYDLTVRKATETESKKHETIQKVQGSILPEGASNTVGPERDAAQRVGVPGKGKQGTRNKARSSGTPDANQKVGIASTTKPKLGRSDPQGNGTRGSRKDGARGRKARGKVQ